MKSRRKFKCSISSCDNTYSSKGNNKFSFFQIPKGKRGARWKKIINQPELVYQRYPRVCEAHFEDRYFRTCKRKLLTVDALPTLHLQSTTSIDEGDHAGSNMENNVNAINEKEVPRVPINLATVRVQSPMAKDRYEIIDVEEIQEEGSCSKNPMRFDNFGDGYFEMYVTGFQPHRKLPIQENVRIPEGIP